MIEATCTACGTVNRIADADVPVGAKFVNCASCKSRVAIASNAAKTVPAGPPRDALDFADLPAPRRGSALGGEVAKPAPRSGLAAAQPEAELPVPRSKKPIAPPPGPGGALDLDDVLAPADGGTDLPAPRPAGQRSLANLPAPKSDAAPPQRPGGGRAVTDLPVPGVADTAPLADLPSPKPKAAPGIVDLPSPKPKAAPGIADLPAPRPKVTAVPTMPPKVPMPAAPGVVDLPSPKPKTPALADLPSPKPKLPAAPPPIAAKPGGVADLPTPKPGGIVDLPMPKAGVTDLPMPKPGQAGDLPAPKGFFDDLPQPARGGGQSTTDVAPKGFFDDLPQPAPASAQTNDIAPKGFFDDLPGRPNQQRPEVPAPKGFFDDLPGRPNQQRPEVPAPKGFFDDLPKPAAAARPGGAIDLGGNDPSNFELDVDANAALELEEPPPPPAPPRMKAASVAPAPGPSNQFDDLDLSAPSPVSFAKGGRTAPAPGGAPPPTVATINPAAAAAAAAAVARPGMPPVGGPKGGDVALELEEPRQAQAPSTGKLGPKQAREARKEKPAAKPKQKTELSPRAKKIAIIVAVGVLALGGGGFYAYRHFAKKAEHEAAVNDQLHSARAAIVASQWEKAKVAAIKTLALEAKQPEALGIRAEALFALGIVEGNNDVRFKQARESVAEALEAGVTHPALERAQALSSLAANQPDKAVPKLKTLVARAPKDAGLQLYLGWAHAAQGELDLAIKAFDGAVASPSVKVHALLGRGRARQAKGDLEGARTDYTDVLAVQKDHVWAQVLLASTLPAAKVQQQEADLLAILVIKDVEKKEPSAAVYAWLLVADIARKSSRLDVARERYRKALAIRPTSVDALTGLAEVELRDGKLDVATEMIDKAIKAAPTEMRPQLVAIEIAIAKKQYEDAASRLATLAKRTPPPPILEQARAKLLQGKLFLAQGKEQDAIDAYMEAAKLAGAQDLVPTLEAAKLLNALADQAEQANDVARASELRKKSDELLEQLSDEAMKNPALALTLGMAYLEANDAIKAEIWLRKALELQPKNVDAMFQLAKALALQTKEAEAIGYLRNAVELEPTRSDIGLELARLYEDAKRAVDAEKLYDKLLGAGDPTLELRARAGRFFARIGQMEKAGVQGVEILKTQEDHPAGLYLKGEGLLKDGKTDAARKLFVQASDVDPEAQYLDARGRAAEAWAKESGNTTYQDDALRAYGEAVKREPAMFSSWLGQGRLYVVRREDAKALDPLQKAWALQQSAEVSRLLGIALKNVNNQPQNAAGWLEKSLEVEPNAETAYHLGLLYTDPRVNNPKKAINAFARAVKLGEAIERDHGQVPEWLPEALYQLGDINRTQNNLKEAKVAFLKWLERSPKKDARFKEVSQALATTLKDL